MSFEAMALKDYYFLKKGEAFAIDPWRDGNIFFGDNKLVERITKRIESDWNQPRRVPKFYVFGDYGSGKTHTLAYISYLLKNSAMQKAEPIYTAVPPLTAKERWQRIHIRLMDAISPERISKTVNTIADRISGPDKVKGLMEGDYLRFGDETLRVSQANVFRNFLFAGRQSQLSWEWMKGRQNTADQATMLGIQKDLSEPIDFVNCILNIGCLYYHTTGAKIVFLLDEAEAFRSVTNADALINMQYMLKLLFDDENKYIGLIMAIQSEAGMSSIGEFFTRDDLYRRIGFEQGLIDLTGMVNRVESAKTFMYHVLEYLIDQDKAEKTIASEKLSTSKSMFPFTEAALDAIADHVNDNPKQASPAYILATMSSAAIEAWRRRNSSTEHVLVTPKIIEECIFPGEQV